MGQLTGGIAHDFNNLLTVIQGNLQVLQDLPLLVADSYGQQLMEAALRGCRRGADLTTQLLAFLRRQVLQPREVDAAQLVASLAEMLRRTLGQSIEIAVDIQSTPPLLADPGQLESALLNIASMPATPCPRAGNCASVAAPATRCRLERRARAGCRQLRRAMSPSPSATAA
ncbi:sensor histidine kinase [Azohydromonas lata]|uniref:histidine kinase n=1 Tax=Azohydromonas lata TaxID=45677 RepID=A0ABU5IE53_9BURK|nr:histidine kinase dimerization/phospho-acceptor domain-containing protein [Azohydromonas lata]MDZ5456785.1 histidine kinase dimerization/phospho-acceptor domain-containing protein [Azohydromonas lata]